MKLTRTFGVVALLLVAGCGKQEGASGAAAPGALGKDAPTGGSAGQALASPFSSQLQQHQYAIDKLKSRAKPYPDPQLDGLITRLDGELNAASAKVQELASAGPERARSIQTELQGSLTKIADLYAQAKRRFMELQAAKP